MHFSRDQEWFHMCTEGGGAWVCFISTDRALLYDGVTCEQSSGDGYQL